MLSAACVSPTRKQRSTMDNKGIGSRIAWTIRSQQSQAELVCRLAPYPLELLTFEIGSACAQAALERYREAQASRRIQVETCDCTAALQKALERVLSGFEEPSTFFFILQDSERQGVYRTSLAGVWACALRILEYDGNTVLFQHEGSASGVLLDREQVTQEQVRYEIEWW